MLGSYWVPSLVDMDLAQSPHVVLSNCQWPSASWQATPCPFPHAPSPLSLSFFPLTFKTLDCLRSRFALLSVYWQPFGVSHLFLDAKTPIMCSHWSPRSIVEMDSPDCTLNNLRNIVGFSGLRDFNDLGKMRLDTLHSRIKAANKRLSRYNVISMCIIWLQTKALQTPFSTLPIETWCTSLTNQRCNGEDVLNFWKYSLENIWLYHQRCDPGSRKIMTKLYEEIKSHLCRGQPSSDEKRAGISGSYPQDAFLGKTMDNHWEPPPPVVKHSVAGVGCAEKTIKLGWEPGESRDGVSTHQTANLCLDRTELLKKRISELVHLDEKPGQEKEAHDQAAQKGGILNNLEASKAPGGLSLTKPLAKDICRRCHTAGKCI